MKKFAWMIAALSLCACSFVACSDDDDKKDDKPTVAKLGDACSDTIKCDTGLKCDNKKCVKDEATDPADGAEGGKCLADDKCDEGLVCNNDKKCVKDEAADPADGAEGGKCRVIEEGADGLPCDANLECKENICVKATSDEKKDDGAACTKDEDCKSNSCSGEEGSKVCIPNEGDEDACTVDTHKITCANVEDKPTAYVCENSVVTAKTCAEGERCDDGKGCVKDESDLNCLDNSDCKDSSLPYCVNSKCVAEMPINADPCKDVNCGADECILGICVSQAMKDVEDKGTWVEGANASGYCVGDKFYYKSDESGWARIIDCKAEGYSGCVVYSPVGNQLVADCNASEEGLKLCKDYNDSTVNTCITSTELYEVVCTTDVTGANIAVPTYKGKDDGTCETGKSCVIEGEAASCK